jgi:hypothetical protein
MKKKRIEMWRKNGWEDDYNTNGLYIRDRRWMKKLKEWIYTLTDDKETIDVNIAKIDGQYLGGVPLLVKVVPE